MTGPTRPIITGCAIGGVLALLGALAAWVAVPRLFYGAWLSAWVLYAGWPLGSMALLFIHALTGGRWGDALRPALLTGVRGLPLLILASLPLLAGLHVLYPWFDPGYAAPNRFYLNPAFFAARALTYLGVWLVLGWVCIGALPLRPIAPFALGALAVTVTFAAFDTTLSLQPQFSSSIYGMLTASGMVLLALTVAVLLTAQPMADFGKLLLALCILWFYLDFMQLLIIWQSDLVQEAGWYVARDRGFWGAVRIAVALLHFGLPFALLLSPRMQASRAVLRNCCWLLLGGEILCSWWIVLPALHRGLAWPDPLCMLALIGLGFGSAWLLPLATRANRHV